MQNPREYGILTVSEGVDEVTETEIRQKLSGIRCFFLDMDGTFYLGNRLIPGSLDFLQALERSGRTARFLTNNSSKSDAMYAEKLRSMAVPAPYQTVITSAHAAARYCLAHFPGAGGYWLCNSVLAEELNALGLRFTAERPAYVLVAFDTTLDYAKLCRTCDFIRAGAPYIATHPDLNCPTETGFVPDVGAIMALIHASTGRWADVVVGKPNAGIVEEALRRTGFSRGETAVVGDRLYTDIAAGKNNGLLSVLVLSGEATLADVEASAIKPDLIFPRLADMIPYLSTKE